MQSYSLRQHAMLSTLLLLIACGGPDINDAEPRVIAGGGIGDGAILGLVNVSVLDTDTNAPISAARVVVGEPGETPLTGTTDSAGLAIVEDDALDGPTTITVTADGYVPSTWFGANGANVTIPLQAREQGSLDVPQARLEGTITGWDALPNPDIGKLLIALVQYSQTGDLDDPANEIAQGMQDNTCIKLPVVGGECNWVLNSRTGSVALFAAIADVETNGSQNPADWAIEVIGFAHNLDTVVQDGVTQSNITLEQLDASAMTDITVDVAPPPGELTASAILGLDMAERGIMYMGILTDAAGQNTVRLPDRQGAYANATYTGAALAAGDDAADGTAAIVRDNLGDGAGSFDFGAWLSLPTVTAESGQFSYERVDGATVYLGSITGADGEDLWAIGLLDGRISFTLPGLDPDPLPTGEMSLSIVALDGQIDVEDFNLDDVQNSIVRTATRSATFTR